MQLRESCQVVVIKNIAYQIKYIPDILLINSHEWSSRNDSSLVNIIYIPTFFLLPSLY